MILENTGKKINFLSYLILKYFQNRILEKKNFEKNELIALVFLKYLISFFFCDKIFFFTKYS